MLDVVSDTYIFSGYFSFFQGLLDDGDDFFGMMFCSLSRQETGSGRSDESLARVGKNGTIEINDAWIWLKVPTPTLLALPSIPSTYLAGSSSIFI